MPISGTGFNSPELRNTTVVLQSGTQTLTNTISLADIQKPNHTTTFNLTFDSSLAGTTQNIRATVDPGNDLQDINFANNVSHVSVDIKSPVDLIAGFATANQTGATIAPNGLLLVAPGVPIQVVVPVSGTGFNSPETRTTVVTLQAGSQPLQGQNVNLADIQNAQNFAIPFYVTFDSSTVGTVQNMIITIDPGNDLGDPNFSNNVTSVKVEVATPTDLPPPSTNVTVPTPGTAIDKNGNTVIANGNSTNCCSGTNKTSGNPVNLATGAMWHELTDFSLQGRTAATALELKRMYLAQPLSGPGDFGPHWTHNWEAHLISAGSDIIFVKPEGGGMYFKRNADNSFQNPRGFFGSLQEFSDHYTLNEMHGITLSFSRNKTIAPIGKLLSLTEAHGESIALTYANGLLSTIQTPLAGTVSFARNAAGLITKATRVRDSLSTTFTYDANGNLASSSDFQGNKTTYSYTSLGTDSLLSNMTDPLGRSKTFQYDSQARCISQTEAGNATRTFTYSSDANGPITTVEEIDGTVSTYFFNAQFLLTETDLPDGGKTYQSWTLQSQIATKTDALGFTTHFGYEGHGNLASIQKPMDPSPLTIAYDQNFDIPTLITPLTGAATSIAVDSANGSINGVSRVMGLTALSLEFTNDTFGNQLTTNNGLTTYSNTRDENGLLTTVFDTNNPETRTYDSRARVIQRTFKSGRILKYTFDDFDRVTEITDSNGPSTSNTYDVLGKLLTRTVSDGKTNQTTTYAWDARDRLVSTTDALGNKTTYSYDPKIIIDKPISTTDALGHVTKFAYDDRDRLVTSTDAKGGVTSYGYNLRGDLTLVVDPDFNQSTFSYDRNGRLISSSRPSLATNATGASSAVTSVTNFSYDLMGKLTKKETLSATGGASQVILKSYDVFDRLIGSIAETEKDGTVVNVDDNSTFAYSPQLDATVLTSANNTVEHLSFTAESAPPFLDTAYTVNPTDPSNPHLVMTGDFTISRDVTNQISELSRFGVTVLSSTYDPAGRLTDIVSGSSLYSKQFEATLTYDGFGRKTGLTDKKIANELVAYDALGRISQIGWIRDGFFPALEETLTYDPVGNITKDARLIGAMNLSYDANNQLTDVTANGLIKTFENPTDSLAYDAAGNRTSSTKNGAASYIANGLVSDQVASYLGDPDGFGNLVEERETKTGTYHDYHYRADGKMDYLNIDTTKQVTHADFYYDALGRRVAKYLDVSGNTEQKFTQSYSYLDNQDKILEAMGGNGLVTLYIDGQGIDEHLGEVSASGAKFYKTNHLGSVVNNGPSGLFQEFGAFGESEGMNFAPSPTTGPVTYGFAGRQYDEESNLYYNRARMYDPTIGRFTVSDSANESVSYVYAKNSPLRYVDPLGFTEQEVNAAWDYYRLISGANIPPSSQVTFAYVLGPNSAADAYTISPGNIVLLPKSYAGSSIDNVSILTTVAHEEQHLEQGFLNTLTQTPAQHVAIEQQAEQFATGNYQGYSSYLDQQNQSVSQKLSQNSCPNGIP